MLLNIFTFFLFLDNFILDPRDLSRFIERGYIDVIDTEVSPGPDEDGNYMVFVEIDKNKNTMKTLKEYLTEAISQSTPAVC